MRYRYTDKEMDTLIKSMVILIDTREKTADHVCEYLAKKSVAMKNMKLDVGDYSFMLPANPDLGIMRDTYFESYVERKNSVDEICGNLGKDKQQAFINELTRSQGSKFVLFVEDENFDYNVAHGNFRSQYKPESLKGRLESLKAYYNFEICPMSREMLPHNLYHRFKYQLRHYLKYGKL